jgi:Tol biopolymer transport system component
MKHKHFIALFSALALGGCSGGGGVTVAERPAPDTGTLVFVRDGNRLMTIRPDGTQEQEIPLTNAPSRLYDPVWNTERTQLAFSGGPDSFETELYLVNRRGGEPQRLTDHPGYDGTPCWDAEGESLSWVTTKGKRGRQQVGEEVWLLPLIQGAVQQLTSDAIIAQTPTRSPKNELIYTNNKGELRLWNGNSTSRALGAMGNQAAWSPDGTRIAFIQNGDVWTMRISDGTVAQVTNTPAQEEATPSWSPDSTQLSFAAKGNLSIVAATGGAPQVLLSTGRDSFPNWTRK